MYIMPDYSKSKLYCVQSKTANLHYYGSTTQRLSARFCQHKKQLDCESKHIVCHDDCEIVLMENYPCDDKHQLRARERWYIENNECINIEIPGRTKKEYFSDPVIKARINTRRKERYATDTDHKQKQMDRARDTYQSLTDEKKQQKMTKALEHTRARDKIRYTCGCGSETTIRNKPNHNRSKKHQAYLVSLETL